MSSRPLIDELGELRFTAGLSSRTIADLAGIARRCEFPGGEIVFREGDACRELFLVSTGHVALDMQVPPRGTVRILTVGAGEMLGWSTLIGNGHMTTSATAVDRVSAIAISGPALQSLCDKDPELGYQMMRNMAIALSRRLLATRLQLLDLFSHDALPAPLPQVQERESL